MVKDYQNKRLLATATTVLNATNMTSEEQCVMSCYYDNPRCLAVNVITTGDVIRCEMTTGLSNKTDMVEDSSSVLYVTGTFSTNDEGNTYVCTYIFFYKNCEMVNSIQVAPKVTL